MTRSCLSLSVFSLLAACGGSLNTPVSAPHVTATSPSNGSSMDLNGSFAAVFSEPMDPATLSESTFTVTGPGTTPVAGAVTYSGTTAVFKPTAALAASTDYIASISTGAKSMSSVALAQVYSWSVTTSAIPDTTKPTISSTVPANAATGVALNGTVAIAFSEAMDPASITATSFTLKRGTTAVAGTVTVDGVNATFTPTAALAAGSSYTANISGAKDLAGNALAAPYGWSFTTGTTADTTAPTVASTVPADAATGTAINSSVTATFSEAMLSSTLSVNSFTVTGPGAAAVSGTVSYVGLIATFRPTRALAASTAYTATIKTGAKDLAGNALAANHAWTFTTGATADTTAPTVTATSPLAAATGVLATAAIQATFSEAMAPLSITSGSFTITGPGNTNLAGSVTYDSATKVATFQPATSLLGNTSYQAKVHGAAGGVTDLAGNVLASDFTWGFTSGTHVNLNPVLLGSAANYVILAKSAVSTVPASVITGDVAVSPAAESYITGFSLTDAIGYATSPQVTGHIFAADQTAPTPSNLTTAVSNMETAYTDAAGRPTPDFLELNTGAIGGLTLSPGLYKWTSTVTIPSDVTFTGTATDVWILQISGDLTMSSAKNVFLSGGAKAKNIFWQVAGAVDLGTTAHFEGIILSQTAITARTGTSMNGRMLAQTAVVLDTTTLTTPAP